MSDPNEADLWHVEVEPGKDQVVTLEQLDDMFRLDLIHANTRVWQPGMSEPMPLSVVAGIDEEEDGGDSIEEIEAPMRAANTQNEIWAALRLIEPMRAER